MCTRPITRDGNTFACRSCDQCIATRRHGWVARAMAEKTDWPHALCIALTYSDATPEGRDGARMFCYADVRAFLKRLASACRYEGKKRGSNHSPRIKFICAGEQGDRNGRCHWHLIIYSDFDLTTVGAFSGRYGPVTDRAAMITVGKRKRRLSWSLWPFGFVTLQEPDQGGMTYVLSYCLKDQFTSEKSHGSMRQASAENFATGLFRMSKRPAIGENFLMQKMEALEASGSVLPALKIHIPDFGGYWHPNGSFREKLLWCLVALNQRAIWSTGAPAPQWAALLASCKDNLSDMEILIGPQKEHPDDEETLEAGLARRGRETAGFQARGEVARRCGSELPCGDCLHELGEDDLSRLGVVRVWPQDGGAWQYVAAEGFDPILVRQRRSGGRLNPFCLNRGSKAARFVFPETGCGAEGNRSGSGGAG